MKHLILLLILMSFNTMAAEFVEEDYIMIGICSVLILQEEHNSKSEKLKGDDFIASFWEETAEIYHISTQQLFESCIKLLNVYAKKRDVII